MADYAELEVSLHRRRAGSYTIEVRFTEPGSDAEARLAQDRPAYARFNFEALLKLHSQPEKYGRLLTHSLFADPAVLSAYAKARSKAQEQGAVLRLRLMVGPSAAELHHLRWETMRDPENGSPLATNERVLFSRYLTSLDWGSVRPVAQKKLKALIVVANPSGLEEFNLAEINVQQELQLAQNGLGGVPVAGVLGGEPRKRATLNNLIDTLRDSSFDVLYLVCHGSLAQGEPWLWLEKDNGEAVRTSGRVLMERLNDIHARLRLVVLASCQSAGEGEGEALAALGPLLAEAGVPAVVAMQGRISLETLARFMPSFFNELQRDGQIDRAMAAARGAIREQPDHWMPVLFLRLRSGRLWYVPGFGSGVADFDQWESLLLNIRSRTCTPIIGYGMVEPLLGSRRDIALRWAEKHGYPLEPQDKEDMPSVAQYIVTHLGRNYLPFALAEAFRDAIIGRYDQNLDEVLRQEKNWAKGLLLNAIRTAAKHYWNNGTVDPHKQLAQLRLPLYITTNPGNLLFSALFDAGVSPQFRICPWNDEIPFEKCQYEGEPTPDRPLIYHLFGHLSEPASLVLAEDDFFDYMIGMTENRRLIPPSVRRALASSALLFLGFQMEDWDFRVIFRSLKAQTGGELRRKFKHIAAQIEPAEGRILNPKRARSYLEEYFGSESIHIYWGSSDEFLKELVERLRR